MTTRVLVVEDDLAIGDVVKSVLTREGFTVTLSRNGEEGFFQAVTSSFDLLLLDVVLPGRSGLEILVALRQHNPAIPVLMLSTKDEVEDRVRALDLQADDYLGKPFAIAELLARIQSLLRRGSAEPVTELQVADLRLNLVAREVSRGGKPIKLTLREFEIMEYLMRNAGRIASRSMLAQDVWKDVQRATPIDNVIDVHMSRLRKKLDVPGQPELLQTIRGIGFRLSERSVDDLMSTLP